MRSIWLRARLDTAPRFCGLEIGRQRWHSKRRAHTESHSAPTPSERVMGRLAVRLALQAIENRVYLSEPVRRVSVSLYINPPSAGPEAVRRGRNRRYCIGERPREQIKAAQPRGLRCARTIQGRVRRSRSRKVAKGYEYRRGQFVTFCRGAEGARCRELEGDRSGDVRAARATSIPFISTLRITSIPTVRSRCKRCG